MPASMPSRRGNGLAFRMGGTRTLLLMLFFHATTSWISAASSHMAPPPAGVVETGAPAFVVRGIASMGLSTPPIDLQLLPDGRLLAVTLREFAIGDGFGWRVFRAAEDTAAVSGRVAIDEKGAIYYGTEGGIARADFGTDARWRATNVCTLPATAGLDDSTMVSVSPLADEWYWHGGSGTIVAWQPGKTPHVVGNVSSIETIFAIDRDIFVSEQSSGGLYRLTSRSGPAERIVAANRLASETVTSTVPFGPGSVLAGTSFNGIKLFDGTSFRSFGGSVLLSGGYRINDLCQTGDGMFAAALDTVGVAFFDRTGRVVQVLDRSLDHRLGRVQKLVYAPTGVLWALLTEGIAAIQFPSAVSRFEPMLASGLAYAKPARHEGVLWLLADGRIWRGVYAANSRLERFEADAPPGRYAHTLTTLGDDLFATNDAGIFVRRDARWELVAGGIVNGRVLAKLANDRLLYVGRDELGIIDRTPGCAGIRRRSVPNLGDTYNAITESSGVIWLELGASRVSRVDPRAPEPTSEIFGPKDGLTDGWVETYILDGTARFHLPSQLLRFDEATRKFVPDQALLARHPQLLAATGRPIADESGRLWYSQGGAVHVLGRDAKTGKTTATILEVGFNPTEYTLETNGVAWIFSKQRLERIDLHASRPPRMPLQALVTDVEFSATNRHHFSPGATLPPIDYADNSLIFHFAAPASPLGPGLSFEVLLEGAGGEWTSTGNVGSARFHRLKEGDYTFRVRPVLGGRQYGEEARVALTIRPPWYRTPLAWGVYAVALVGLLGSAIWLPTFIQRHENERLERLVARRTEELNTTNRQLERQIGETTSKSAALAASEERFRVLNVELERRVQERTAQLSLSNEELQQRESLFRLIFEHAPVGISWKRTDLGNIYHFNQTFRRILRLPVAAPSESRFLENLIHPEDAPQLAKMNRLIASGAADSYLIEQRFVLPDSSVVWTALSVAVIRDPLGRIIQDIGILEDITARKRAEAELATTYKNLVDASRMAGMAEVATGVLHNVGNVLNSLNVSANLIANGVRQSKPERLMKLSKLVDQHAGRLAEFLTEDPKGRLVPELLSNLAQHTLAERDWLENEVSSMQKNIDHIKEIVAMQQSYATVIGVVETLQPSALFEDALRINNAALVRHDVTVVREYLPTPKVHVEKGKILQILINLVRNAKYACDAAPPPDGGRKLLTVRVEPAPNDRVRLIVRDNGIGIAPENLTRIFAHGFTTRAYGHGFGLHSSAIAAKELKGTLTACSDGLGRGATFVLEIPIGRHAAPVDGKALAVSASAPA